MLTERSRDKALEAFLKGRKVIVLSVYDDGSITSERLEDMLPTEDIHYLVDVPAVENPEFKEAVANMVQSEQKQENPSAEDKCPPSGRPEVSDMLADKKGNRNQAKARELAAQGMAVSQIAAEVGIKDNTGD